MRILPLFRLLGAVLTMTILLFSASALADALPNEDVMARFQAAEALYPNGKYWNDIESGDFVKGLWSSTPCEGNSVREGTCRSLYFGNGWQCWGFANTVAQVMFGSCPERGGALNGWTREEGSREALERLEPGDYVRKQTPKGNGHSFIVWKVIGERVYAAAECHGLDGCRIDWYASSYGFDELLEDEENMVLYVWHHPGASTAARVDRTRLVSAFRSILAGRQEMLNGWRDTEEN